MIVDGEPAIERRSLGDVTEAIERGGPVAERVHPEDGHRPGARRLEPDPRLHQGRLARAVRSDERGDAPDRDVEGGAVQRADTTAVPLGDRPCDERRDAGGSQFRRRPAGRRDRRRGRHRRDRLHGRGCWLGGCPGLVLAELDPDRPEPAPDVAVDRPGAERHGLVQLPLGRVQDERLVCGPPSPPWEPISSSNAATSPISGSYWLIGAGPARGPWRPRASGS